MANTGQVKQVIGPVVTRESVTLLDREDVDSFYVQGRERLSF